MAATGKAIRLDSLTSYPWNDSCGDMACHVHRVTPMYLPDYDPDDTEKWYRVEHSTPLVEVLALPNTFTPMPSAEVLQENCDEPVVKSTAKLITKYCFEVNQAGDVRQCICCQCPGCSSDEVCSWKCGEWRTQDLRGMTPTTFKPEHYIVGDYRTGLVRL